MRTDDPQIEDRLREAFAVGAGAEPAVPPPFVTSPAAVVERRRRGPLLVASCLVAAVALAITATVVFVEHDEPDQVIAVDPPTTEAPLLGPLPYLGFTPGGPAVTSVEANTTQDEVYEGFDSSWWDQTFQSERGTDHPATLQIITIRHPADGPRSLDDVSATYTDSHTDPVSVQGSPARMLRQSSSDVSVWWPSGGPAGTIVRATGLHADQVLAIAEAMRPRLDHDGWDVTDLPAALVPVKDARRVTGEAKLRWSYQIDFRLTAEATGSLSVTSAGDDVTPPIPENAGDITELDIVGHPATAYINDEIEAAQVVWVMGEAVATIFMMGPAATIDSVRTIAAALVTQTQDEWVRNLPPASLTRTRAAALLSELGATTPLPDGQHLTSIRRPPGQDPLVVRKDSVLGTAVLQARCAWIEHWMTAMEDGDDVAAGAAITALEGAATWGVVLGLDEPMRTGMLDDFALPLSDMRAGDLEAIQQRHNTPAGC